MCWYGRVTEVGVRVARSSDLQDILTIHRTHKRWLGHLPTRPFEEAIGGGRLLVAVGPSGRIDGYVLYRVRTTLGDAAIVHLAVRPDSTGRGVATSLVTALCDALDGLRRVVLSCRQDYPAHQFWLRSGFEAISEGPGKSADGKPLTQFERRLRAEATLFDGLYEASDPFAVDLDVLIDLASERPQGELTRAVFRQLDQLPAHPIRTISLSNELIHHRTDSIRTKARTLMSTWEQANYPGTPDRLDQLVAMAPGAELSDLRHVCDAEANGITDLLTRDVGFQRAMETAEPGCTSVRVVHPATFVDRLMNAGSPVYRPAQARGLSVANASSFPLEVLVDAFLSGRGEKKSDFRGHLQATLASAKLDARCLVRDSLPVGLFCLRADDATVEITTLRARLGESYQTIVRQALAAARTIASSATMRVMTVSEPERPSELELALAREGFHESGGHWFALPLSGVSTCRSMADAARATAESSHAANLAIRATTDPTAAASLEAHCDPLILTESALPAVLVAVRAGWADRLIGVTPGQLALDVSGGPLGGLREHVYFRSPFGPSLEAPLRVFWYRTRQQVSSVYATSLVDKITVRNPDEIWGRFGGYGVLRRDEVTEMSDKHGEVMALRFVRIRMLKREVSLAQLRAAAAKLGVGQPAAPVSPRFLDPLLHQWLLEEVGVE